MYDRYTWNIQYNTTIVTYYDKLPQVVLKLIRYETCVQLRPKLCKAFVVLLEDGFFVIILQSRNQILWITFLFVQTAALFAYPFVWTSRKKDEHAIYVYIILP
jgi:hypothetical protein